VLTAVVVELAVVMTVVVGTILQTTPYGCIIYMYVCYVCVFIAAARQLPFNATIKQTAA